MAHYLICYDIANPRRLGRVHRCTVKHAMFVQYSVYYLNGSHEELHELLDKLRAIINNEEDDVRAYSVQPLNQAIQVGRNWLPDEILLMTADDHKKTSGFDTDKYHKIPAMKKCSTLKDLL